MNEEEMTKRLQEALGKTEKNQLNFSFFLAREKNSEHSFPCAMSNLEKTKNTFYQEDFLTHKILNFKDNKD